MTDEQAIIEWVERQWPDGPAFECAQLLRANLLKLGTKDAEIAELHEWHKQDREEVATWRVEVANLQSRLDAALEALRECHRLADESKDDFEEKQNEWLAAVYAVANEALQATAVENHAHNYGDDGRCSCGIHALD